MQPIRNRNKTVRNRGTKASGEIEQNSDELRLVVAVLLQAKGPEVWTDGAYLLAATRNMTMKELIQKIEARIAERRGELEGWINTSRMVCEAIESEIVFLESLLAEIKAMAEKTSPEI
jgi:vacuolar-type H+-ATPase subunit I/STV1